MRWAEMGKRQPKLTERVRASLLDPGVVLVGTITKDGTPRISPVEPYLLDGDLWLSMMWQSHKAHDLERDPRILVHSIVRDREGSDGEVKVRGHAVPQHDPAVQQRYADSVAEAIGWHAEAGRFHLFAIDIQSVTSMQYEQPSGDQYGTVWPPGREFVRRATSATSVGAPEPVTRYLVPE